MKPAEDRRLKRTYRLVHEVRGRIRVEVTRGELLEIRTTSGRTALEQLLSGAAGVRQVRVNELRRSVAVLYDPTLCRRDELFAALERSLSKKQLHRFAAGHDQAGEGSDELTWTPLALSTVAAAASVAGGPAASAVLVILAALPIFERARVSLRTRGKLNVDVLDAAATAVLCIGRRFGAAAAMVWLVSLGELIRDLTARKAHRAIETLFRGRAEFAWVVRDGGKQRIPVDGVVVGDQLVVYAGELVPVDGAVVKGEACIDQSALTGESMPAVKTSGHEVFAGTVVREGKVYVRATRVGKQTRVSNILRLLRDAPTHESRVQNYAERFADRVVPWSFAGAGACILRGDLGAASGVLIADYGTGIRIAAPTAVLAALASAARHGVLIKGGRYIEKLAAVDTIIFDKTGTLTTGKPEISDVVGCNGYAPQDVLRFAASAEVRYRHPVAEAIVQRATRARLALLKRRASTYRIGLGVAAYVDRARVLVGCDRFLRLYKVPLAPVQAELETALADGTGVAYVAIGDHVAGLLVYADPVVPEAEDAIAAMRAAGVNRIMMLTGDSAAVAEPLARKLGIAPVVAGMLPEEKQRFVKRLQREGHCVAFVGDGVNDSPALAQADVGIAVYGGTDAASETADVTLLERDLRKIPFALAVARNPLSLVDLSWRINLYPNTAAIALSLFGMLGPVGATLLSNGAAVAGALNGLRPLIGDGFLTRARGTSVRQRSRTTNTVVFGRSVRSSVPTHGSAPGDGDTSPVPTEANPTALELA